MSERSPGLDGDRVNVDISTTLAAGDRDAAHESKVPSPLVESKQPKTLAELIASVNNFLFDLSDRKKLFNQFDSLDEAATKLLVRYLLVCFQQNEDPATGKCDLTKAVKFATGQKKLATSAAYDVIKRLLKRNRAVFAWAMSQPLLQMAYAQAESTRVSNPPKKASNEGSGD